MTLKVLLVDDESLAREALKLRLALAKGFNVVGEADNGEDALLLVSKLKPDVVFLDINMPQLSGIQAARDLERISSAQIVFVTAYEQHALEAFRLNAVDYLTKPINDQFFAQTLVRISQRHQSEQAIKRTKLNQLSNQYLKRIALTDGNETIMVDTKGILSVQSVRDYLCIKVGQRNFVIRQTMKQICALLDPQSFLRCHRSHLLNMEKIESLQQNDEGTFLSCHGKLHPVSRRYLPLVKSKLKTLFIQPL